MGKIFDFVNLETAAVHNYERFKETGNHWLLERMAECCDNNPSRIREVVGQDALDECFKDTRYVSFCKMLNKQVAITMKDCKL